MCLGTCTQNLNKNLMYSTNERKRPDQAPSKHSFKNLNCILTEALLKGNYHGSSFVASLFFPLNFFPPCSPRISCRSAAQRDARLISFRGFLRVTTALILALYLPSYYCGQTSVSTRNLSTSFMSRALLPLLSGSKLEINGQGLRPQ